MSCFQKILYFPKFLLGLMLAISDQALCRANSAKTISKRQADDDAPTASPNIQTTQISEEDSLGEHPSETSSGLLGETDSKPEDEPVTESIAGADTQEAEEVTHASATTETITGTIKFTESAENSADDDATATLDVTESKDEAASIANESADADTTTQTVDKTDNETVKKVIGTVDDEETVTQSLDEEIAQEAMDEATSDPLSEAVFDDANKLTTESVSVEKEEDINDAETEITDTRDLPGDETSNNEDFDKNGENQAVPFDPEFTEEIETTTTTASSSTTSKSYVWFKPVSVPGYSDNSSDAFRDQTHMNEHCPNLNCEFGYKTDLYGKPLCSCFNPCYVITLMNQLDIF